MTERKQAKTPENKHVADAADSVVRKTAKKSVKKAVKRPVKAVAERALISFDYAVKYLLRGKRDFVILSGFLTELMGKKIEVKAILESESNKADPGDKTNRVDLKAQINGGEFAVFEIQFLQEHDFFGKVLFGVSQAVIEQVSSGKFYNIKKVHSINIAYSNLNAKREYLFSGKLGGFHGVHYTNERIPFARTGTPKSKKKVDIHPEYYLILPNMFDEKMRSRFDEWVYVLKNSKVRDDFKAAGIKEAKKKLDYLSMPPDERKEYERYMEYHRSANSVTLTAEGKGWHKGLRKGRKEGLQEGLEKGLQKGRQEGLQKGLQKGRQEGLQKGLQKGRQEGLQKGRQEAIAEAVKKMHPAGFTVAQIVKGLGLPAKNVKDILRLTLRNDD